jgi:hypothetical protein
VHHSVPRRKHWPIRHKIWTVILSVIGLFVILGIAGAVAGSPKATSSAAAQTSNGPHSPQAKVAVQQASACYGWWRGRGLRLVRAFRRHVGAGG